MPVAGKICRVGAASTGVQRLVPGPFSLFGRYGETTQVPDGGVAARLGPSPPLTPGASARN